MNDMYSYTAYTAAGAGLPAAKRLQVNQLVSTGTGHVAETANLDSTYTYNNEGKLTAMTYPSTDNGSGTSVPGASYNYSYDSMYRLSGMTTSGGTTVVNGVSYNAANQLLGMTYNGIGETRGYNVLNQLTSIVAGSTENLTYTYPAGPNNNGKVSSMYNAVSGETVTYTYDSLTRLATAAGSGWGEAYTFDGFGNLTTKHVTAGSGPSLSVSVNPANNQIEGLGGYDLNGNAYLANVAYDVENHIYALVGESPYTSYAYDAQGKRIFMWGGTSDSNGNPTGYSVIAYSPGGQKLGTYQFIPGTGHTTYIIAVSLSTSDQYFGGRRLAVQDQLGSAGTYFPWGEAKGSTNPQDTWSYATYWRDSATGLDYANNRYYSNAYGSFMTPDPTWRSANLKNPQSWNRYAYVTGDPVNSNDPTGLDGFNGDGGVCPNIALAECGGDDPGIPDLPPPIPPGASYPISIPSSITYPVNGGPGDIGSLSVNLTNGSFTFDFADAQDGAIVIGACVAQPELCVFIGGSILTIYVVTTYGPALFNAIQSQITSRQAAPVYYPPYNAGRDSNGNCNKPDPDKYVKWQGTGGDHWHWITWNQDPTDCMTYGKYMSGPNDPGPQYKEIPR